MSYILPLQLTSDRYTAASTLLSPGGRKLLITVRTPAGGVAGSVYYQLGSGSGGSPQWELGAERLLTPGTLGRSIRCDAIRFRSAAPGVPQYVTAEVD